MLTFKEYLGNPSIGVGPAADVYKPMASLGSPHQFPPTTNRKYTTTFSSYLGKGHGTIKPMLTAKKLQTSKEIYYNLDRGIYTMGKDFKKYDREKEKRQGFPNATKLLSTTKAASDYVAKKNKK